MASLASDTAGPLAYSRGIDRLRETFAAVLLGVSFFAFAAPSMAYLGTNTPLWFCNAGAVAWALQVRGRRWPLLLTAVWVADSIAIYLSGASLAPMMALGDVSEILLSAWLIRRAGGAAVLLTSVGGLVQMILIFLSVPILSSSWGASVLWAEEGGSYFALFSQWYASTSLGLLIVCPALLIWLTPELRPGIDRAEGWRLALLSTGLALFASLVLSLGRPELLFALFPVLLLLVWSSGLAGASVGSIVLAGIGTIATLWGAETIRVLVLPLTDIASQIVSPFRSCSPA